MELDESVHDYIATLSYDKQYGARPLRRIITSKIENELSDRILGGEIKSGDFVVINCENESIRFKIKNKTSN